MARDNAKSLAKSKGGAPTVVTPDVETKLESILKIGGTIAEATTYAGIGERTYYDRKKADDKFSQKMERAKHYADVAAKNVVVRAITEDKDLTTAKWWLEKREFRDGQNLTQVNVNVQPILGGSSVQTNKGNEENTETKKED